MDFERTIMKAAQQTAQSNGKKEIKYYSTKFEPPKKLQRNKSLSSNIQKFLARKEEEDKQKAMEAKDRRDKLLELRSHDKKATRRVSVMLKRTKSANQSAIQDAVDRDNTSVTLAGGSQPDEDDYGYVSQSAADYYNKMMEKYKSMPDVPKYDFTKKKSNGSLSSTKDRVRHALDREQEEAAMPHRRKRKSGGTREGGASGGGDEIYEEVKREEPKAKPKLKAAPVINFTDLLKIAEKKQFEPIKVEPKKEKKDDERLLTKKQKREAEKEREYRLDREKREKERAQGTGPAAPAQSQPKIPKLSHVNANANEKIPKLNGKSAPAASSNNGIKRREESSTSSSSAIAKTKPPPSKCDISNKRPEVVPKNHNAGPSSSNGAMRRDQMSQKPPASSSSSNGREMVKGRPQSSTLAANSKPKEFPPRDLKPKQFPPRDLMKTKQFPPPDVRGRPMAKRKPMAVKGRIYDDDDEDYDSEMDDFIDDGPEGEEDYSKYISEIFGYDKRKYRYLDDDVDNMETTFAQQMREEVISTKIGIMEDMEELRKEEEHNRRKAVMKKKMK